MKRLQQMQAVSEWVTRELLKQAMGESTGRRIQRQTPRTPKNEIHLSVTMIL